MKVNAMLLRCCSTFQTFPFRNCAGTYSQGARARAFGTHSYLSSFVVPAFTRHDRDVHDRFQSSFGFKSVVFGTGLASLSLAYCFDAEGGSQQPAAPNPPPKPKDDGKTLAKHRRFAAPEAASTLEARQTRTSAGVNHLAPAAEAPGLRKDTLLSSTVSPVV